MKITEYIKSNIVLLDGGMGTLLQQNDIPSGTKPECWNVSRPGVIRDIHKSYLQLLNEFPKMAYLSPLFYFNCFLYKNQSFYKF